MDLPRESAIETSDEGSLLGEQEEAGDSLPLKLDAGGYVSLGQRGEVVVESTTVAEEAVVGNSVSHYARSSCCTRCRLISTWVDQFAWRRASTLK